MTVKKDNQIDPNIKARWGFSGDEGEITVGPQTVGETGGVDHARSRIEEGGGRNSGGGAEPSREALQLDAVNTLAAGLEAGVLNPVEGEGPAMRLYQALSGIQSGMQNLADARDAAVSKSEELQKQVDDLLAQAEKDRLAAATDPLDELTVVQIKEQLDAKGVTYKVNDSKPELLALLKANQ
ncbi:hypothetical protein CXF97_13365 [Pseudomonas sp. Choline-02u-1]|uniref:hypothetical protein n=1 Tax=Pseudomonas sp. Choline-02u-1 TaxID=2058307 RepID=UPI000C3283E2|nr:hypothetical protein [Pseudomonas sp. Choline-02u-1]PKH81904.1 hypothetical protein CXF97_13365 [Pseudomonas sp. Choline-02u-1]